MRIRREKVTSYSGTTKYLYISSKVTVVMRNISYKEEYIVVVMNKFKLKRQLDLVYQGFYL